MLRLIGTSHLDPNGYDRLCKLLASLEPSVVGIEETREDFEETSRLVTALSNPQIAEKVFANARKQYPHANPETLRRWISSINYENRAITEYSAAKKVPIVYCDDSQELKRVDFDSEVKTPDSSLNREINAFLRQSPKEVILDIKGEYSQSEYPVTDCKNLVAFYQARDECAERVLRNQTGNVVYVCGLDHIFGDYHPNLFDRLENLNPKRVKLCEADYL